ncbi:MAG: exodeoxyribonuclease V subunit alpha [Pseudomonadota bacterium]
MSAPRTLPPVFAPAVVTPGSPEQAALDALAPFYAAGVLESVDLHVVAWLGRRVGLLDPAVLLACALAVRAPRHGHICVDLEPLGLADLLPAEAELPPGPPPHLPGPGWAERVAAAAPLVRRVGEARLTPFVLRGSVLYTDRSWRYEAGLAARVRAWAGTAGRVPIAREDLALLDRGLLVLFAPPGGEPQDSLNLQRVAGATALLRQFTVITGGPGMGKTWTVRNLLALLWLRHRARVARGEVRGEAPAVALAAPTGKAAARMREALRDGLDATFLPALAQVVPAAEAEAAATWLKGLEARTLHRLLVYRPDNPTRFRHHAEHPLPYDAVIVDEASMVDLPLMAKLAAAIGPRGPAGEPTRLVLLGDRHQLASVEAGTVLADLCGPTEAGRLRLTPAMLADLEAFGSLAGLAERQAPGVVVEPVANPAPHDCVVQFNRSFRFPVQSGIGAFAAACLLPPGQFSAAAAAQALETGPGGVGRASLLPWGPGAHLPESALALALEGYRPYLELLARGWREPNPALPTEEVFHRRVLQAFDRFRVLCAHRDGPGSAAQLNERIQARLYAAGLLQPAGSWWPGRPVLIQRNDYDVRRSGGGRGLFNGDIGLCVPRGQGAQRHLTVVFPGPDGLPPADPNAALPADHHLGRRLVEYVEPARLPEHSTVFAMTIHKSQGSEFQRALVILPPAPSPILTRELIYTAVTRAREAVTVVAERAVLEGALSQTVRRASGLEGAVWRE